MVIGLGIATVETVVSGEHRCSGFACGLSPTICRVTGEGRVGSCSSQDLGWPQHLLLVVVEGRPPPTFDADA